MGHINKFVEREKWAVPFEHALSDLLNRAADRAPTQSAIQGLVDYLYFRLPVFAPQVFTGDGRHNRERAVLIDFGEYPQEQWGAKALGCFHRECHIDVPGRKISLARSFKLCLIEPSHRQAGII